MMDTLIARFPDQLEEALELASRVELPSIPDKITHIYVAGMGGSGIGADFAKKFSEQNRRVPMEIGKGYSIPSYIDSRTFALVSSYSGNTEETLIAYDQLKQAGAQIVAITSGGKLEKFAQGDGFQVIKMPADWPSPRACLGYSLILQMAVLNAAGLGDVNYEESTRNSILRMRKEIGDLQERAERIATFLIGKTPVIYATDYFDPVAVRFRQQINENAKMLCWHHIIPEMNHNELVGWRDGRPDLAVIALRSKSEFKRNQLRFDINKEIISKYAGSWIELYAKGQGILEETLYLVHLTDWVSYYLADKREMDAVEVKVIDFLKSQLADN